MIVFLWMLAVAGTVNTLAPPKKRDCRTDAAKPNVLCRLGLHKWTHHGCTSVKLKTCTRCDVRKSKWANRIWYSKEFNNYED